MRRTIVVIILTLVIIAFAIFQSVFLINVEKGADEILDKLEYSVYQGDWQGAEAHSRELFEYVESRIEVLGWLVYHEGPDDIQLEIATLKSEIANRETEYTIASAERVRLIMEDVRRSDSFSLRNVF